MSVALVCVFFSLTGFGRGEDPHTPDYYEQSVRADFKRGNWERGKRTLDVAMKYYPDVAVMNELCGRYHLHGGRMDEARYYLQRALRDDNDNVNARHMLVEVEDKTGNYSSAICYVNELLEVNPYWRGLWLKKIDLFRKQGNTVESDRLLRRIFQIYPNDTTLRNRYLLRLEDHYQTATRRDRGEAIAALRELIRVAPDRPDYYADLCNLCLGQGNKDEALAACNQGLTRFPSSTPLIVKKAGILAEEYRMVEALDFVKASMRVNHTGEVAGLYGGLLVEAARVQSMHDPYTLYGKVYDTQHSAEALNYLLNTSITRGYDDDALFYLAEARKRRGNTLELRMKEYAVNKRMGNRGAAGAILNSLYEMYPDNYDVATEMALTRLDQATPLLTDGLYSEALPYLRSAVRAARDGEVKEAALSRMLACYTGMRRWTDAHATLDSLHAAFPQRDDYEEKCAGLLDREGKRDQALALLAAAMADTSRAEMRGLWAAQYEDIALPHIKGLIQSGALVSACHECDRLLAVNPSSADGLRLALSANGTLGRTADYDRLLSRARQLYPDDMTFLARQASAYGREGQWLRALDLVRPPLDSLRGDTALIRAFSEASEQYALDLTRRGSTDSAMAVIDTALVFDAQSEALLYTKGTVYEKRHEYDSAYVYQRHLTPKLIELADFRRHLMGLRSHGMKNVIGLEYLQGRYGQEDIITSVATGTYTHKGERDDIGLVVNYAGRDGGSGGSLHEEETPGGVGVQVGAQWTRRLGRRWEGTAEAAWGSRYFPSVSVALSLTRHLARDWDITARASVRRIAGYTKTFYWDQEAFNEETSTNGLWTFDHWNKSVQNLYTLALGTAKELDRFRFSARVDGMMLRGNPYVNGTGEAKFFPLSDGETAISLLGSVGTAPEATLIDNAMPTSFSHLNSMVGLSGRLLLTHNLSLGVTGTWHTFFAQVNARRGGEFTPEDFINTRYKNLFNLNVQLYVKF